MSPQETTAAASFIQYAQYALLATAVFVALGGIMGFVKARSKASIIAGVTSAVILAVCYYVSLSEAKYGLIGACIILTALDMMFAVRLKKTKKFMPSGMMIVVCSLAEVIVVLGALQAFGMI